ncbi:MAG: hypothetical protein ABW084_02670 [Candidatus Thiodiazotropha sp.]
MVFCFSLKFNDLKKPVLLSAMVANGIQISEIINSKNNFISLADELDIPVQLQLEFESEIRLNLQYRIIHGKYRRLLAIGQIHEGTA